MTLLCVPIFGETLDAAADAMRRAERDGAELLELRLDLLPPGAAVLISQAKAAVLATCRDPAEGGGRAVVADDAVRGQMLAEALRHGASLIDFEFAAWRRSPAARKTIAEALDATAPAGRGGNASPPPAGRPARLILSAHDFRQRPTRLGELAARMADAGADVVKIAYKAEHITDCFDALDILHEADRPTIALAMGEAGAISRLLAKKLGAFLTFAALDAGQGTAPGQPTLADFKRLYRWDRIGAGAPVYGVIGCPVAHSMSPAIHNAAFDAAGLDGLYVPMLVEKRGQKSLVEQPEQPGNAPKMASDPACTLAAFLDGLLARPWLDVRGLSITIPHKESALAWLRARGGEIEPLAERIGAVNTIRVGDDGSLAGRNTDYAAAREAVCGGLGCDLAGLRGRRVAVLGAGGVARAIVAGFADAGARVTIINRTRERAEKLAEEFGCEVRDGCEDANEYDAIVNATSVGMHPNADATPLRLGASRSCAEAGGQGRALPLIFDTVYNPIQTRLLREARACGAATVDGVAMFVRQAAGQFEWWTGVPAPVDVMRPVVVERLTEKASQ